MYTTKSFHCYENREIDEWLNARQAEGYILVNFKAVGSSTVLFIMEKK